MTGGCGRIGFLAAVLLLNTAPVANSQAPAQPQTASVAGRVIDAASGRGIPNAAVRVRSSQGSDADRGTFTGETGEFRMTGVQPGSYEIVADVPGFLAGRYGQRRPGGHAIPVQLAAGQQASAVDILMWRPAVISGRVMTEHGEPVIGVSVRAVPRRAYERPRSFENAGGSDRTNDLGEYELSLVPDEYVVLVPVTHIVWPVPTKGVGSAPGHPYGTVFVTVETSRDGRFNMSFEDGVERPVSSTRDDPKTYVTTLYPSASTLDHAQTIRVEAGSVHRHLDIRLVVKPHRRVIGRAVDEHGRPLAQVVLRFHSNERTLPFEGPTLATPIQVKSHDDGVFEMMRIPPGVYEVEAFRQLADSDVILFDEVGLWARTRLEVGERDVTGFEVTLKPGVEVTGSLAIHRSRPAVTLPSISLAARDGTDGGVQQTSAPGRFRLSGVRPGRYVVRGHMSELMVSAITLDGRDVIDKPIDVGEGGVSSLAVTFTDRVTTIVGSVTDRRNAPVAGATVVIFPANPHDRETFGEFPLRMRRLQSGHDGTWSTSGLPPGDYLVTAIDDARLDDWPDLALLEALSREARRLTVVEGSAYQLTLRLDVR